MINRADYLARTVLYPQQQPPTSMGGGRPALGGAGAAPDFGIPEPSSGLQYTGKIAKLSQKYYQDYEALKGFAKQMWKQYGVDVTAPPSTPEGAMAAQTFQQQLANLRFIGDMLEQSQKQFTPALAGNVAGSYEFGDQAFDQPYAMNTPDQAGYSTNLPEAFDLAKSAINQRVDTTGEFDRLKGMGAQFSKPYVQAALENPNDPKAAYQAEASRYLTPTFDQQTSGDGSGYDSSIKSVKTWADELARLATGTHSSYTLSNKYAPSGKPYREARPAGIVGSIMGHSAKTGDPFVVAFVREDPDTEKVYVVSQTGEVQPLDPNNLDPALRSLQDSNRGIWSTSDYNKFLQSTGIKGGVLPASEFVAPVDYSAKEASKPEAAQRGEKVVVARQALRSNLEALGSGTITRLKNITSKIPIVSSIVNAWSPTSSGASYTPTEMIAQLPSSDGVTPDRTIKVVKDGDDAFRLTDASISLLGTKDNKGNVVINGKPIPLKGRFTKAGLEGILKTLEDLGVINVQLQDKDGNVVTNESAPQTAPAPKSKIDQLP